MVKIYYNGFIESPEKKYEGLKDSRIKCPHCGHTLSIPAFESHQICSWCKHKVINNTKDRFKYMLKKKMEEENENIKKRI